MLLSYSKYLKIIISITNITPYNWGEIRSEIVIKNSIFIIDLSCLLKKKKVKSKNIIEFARFKQIKYYKREICYVNREDTINKKDAACE